MWYEFLPMKNKMIEFSNRRKKHETPRVQNREWHPLKHMKNLRNYKDKIQEKYKGKIQKIYKDKVQERYKDQPQEIDKYSAHKKRGDN